MFLKQEIPVMDDFERRKKCGKKRKRKNLKNIVKIFFKDTNHKLSDLWQVDDFMAQINICHEIYPTSLASQFDCRVIFNYSFTQLILFLWIH